MNILKHLLKLNLFLFVCLFLTSKCNVHLVCSWSGLPFPSLGELPNPGIKPASPALAGGFITAELPGKPMLGISLVISSPLLGIL